MTIYVLYDRIIKSVKDILARKGIVGQMSIRRCNEMAEKKMNSYETIFIIDSTLEPDAIAAEKDKFVNLISANGELGEVEEWGKRKLAYAINFKTEGYYVLVNFKADVEFPKELDRRYRIDENILRTIIIRKDEA